MPLRPPDEAAIPANAGGELIRLGQQIATDTARCAACHSAFIKANMPLRQGGTINDPTASAIATWFTRQPRPDFAAWSFRTMAD